MITLSTVQQRRLPDCCKLIYYSGDNPLIIHEIGDQCSKDPAARARCALLQDRSCMLPGEVHTRAIGALFKLAKNRKQKQNKKNSSPYQ